MAENFSYVWCLILQNNIFFLYLHLRSRCLSTTEMKWNCVKWHEHLKLLRTVSDCGAPNPWWMAESAGKTQHFSPGTWPELLRASLGPPFLHQALLSHSARYPSITREPLTAVIRALSTSHSRHSQLENNVSWVSTATLFGKCKY